MRVKMKRFFFVLAGVWMGVVSLHGEEARLFEQANRQFDAGADAEAASGYQKVLEQDGPSGEVYYNLGNVYQRQGQWGRAILSYERARLLTPRDPDLRANLAMARKAVAAFEESELDPRLEGFLQYMSRDEWSRVILGSAFFIGFLSVFDALAKSRGGRWRWWSRLSVSLAAVLLLLGSVVLFLRRDEANRGVIIAESSVLRLSPFLRAESLATPGQGKMVRIRYEDGDFLYVEIPGSKVSGWLAKAEVARIADSSLP
jgi:hypothetical protein